MSKLKELEAFVQVANKGSLTAAAAGEGVTPAIIGRRLDALEDRLGVRLLVRTTRKLTLTQEGEAFLEDCQRILTDLANAEAQLSLGSARASGHLKVTAPAGFGRKHVAPLLREFLRGHPEVSASLDLADRTVDLVGEGIDCAVRLGGLVDSSLVAVRLGEMKRVVVGSPGYFQQRGVPRSLDDLASHDCLALATQPGWDFQQGGQRNPAVQAARAVSSATMARCCTNGRSPAWGWRGVRCGRWAKTCAGGGWSRCLMSWQRRRWVFTPCFRNAATCRCGCGCSSTCSRTITGGRITGIRPNKSRRWRDGRSAWFGRYAQPEFQILGEKLIPGHVVRTVA